MSPTGEPESFSLVLNKASGIYHVLPTKGRFHVAYNKFFQIDPRHIIFVKYGRLSNKIHIQLEDPANYYELTNMSLHVPTLEHAKMLVKHLKHHCASELVDFEGQGRYVLPHAKSSAERHYMFRENTSREVSSL